MAGRSSFKVSSRASADVARPHRRSRSERHHARASRRRADARRRAPRRPHGQRAAGSYADPGTDARVSAEARRRRGGVPPRAAVDHPAHGQVHHRAFPLASLADLLIVSFDLFAPGSATILVLLAARVGGLVMVAPIFSTKNVPLAVRACIIVLLTALMQPVAMSQATSFPTITPETFMGETLVGFALGLGAALLVGAASVAGDVMGMQIGL